ncbi:hypothetical protein [Natronobiforma cellulositropha]|uniref:hypothetical protein n=1 Tax=Natronobiforma cellulositropha TaxID=1679076 RepID=UPI0021D604CF|nr:hypothetical protein [Natronobiforma cellulositropha]
MVDARTTDGKRIAQLLASELEGRADSGLCHLAVTNADREVEAGAEWKRAYDVSLVDSSQRLARVSIREAEARLTFDADASLVAECGSDMDCAVSDADGSARLLVESGAAVKRAARLLGSVARSLEVGE